MTRKKYKSLILPISLIVLSLVVIVSTTLAYFTDKQSSDSPVSFGKVEITAGEMETLSTPLRDVIAGSKITDKITFSKAVDSESMYVRAKVYFSTDSDVQAVKDLVAELNSYDLGALGESSAYSWSAKYNNIHYLVSKTDTSNAYALTNNDVITLSNGFSVPIALKQPANLAQYMQKVSFNIEIQAIQSATIDAEVKNVDAYFVDIFGDKGVQPFPMGKFTNVSGTAGYTSNANLVDRYYIELGSYPQTLYEGDASALTIDEGKTYNLSHATGLYTSAVEDCPVYKDASNNKYVKFTNKDSEVSYYKIEPVRWIIIGQADGTPLPDDFDIATTSLDEVLVVSEKVLTQRIFNLNAKHTTTNGDQALNDWEGSGLNTFMNGAFMDDLFTLEERALIQFTTYSTTYNNDTSAQTLVGESRMFPLAINTQSGNTYSDTYLVDLIAEESVSLYDEKVSLYAENTDLATAMGVNVNSSTGFGYWWLRSGFADGSITTCTVNGGGFVNNTGVDYAGVGVRCAFVVSL